MADIEGGPTIKGEKLYELTPSGGALAIDLSKYSSFNFKWTHTDGDTVTFSNPPLGVSKIRCIITDPGDGTDVVFAPTASILEPGGTEPTWTASGVDMVEFTCVNDGSSAVYYQTGIFQDLKD